MPLPGKENKTLDPFPISGLGANRVVLEAHHLTDLIEKFELGVGDEAFPGS